MSDLDEMWKRLEAHQSLADIRGYGPAWKAMCQERTKESAEAARKAAGHQEKEWKQLIKKESHATTDWAKARGEIFAAAEAAAWAWYQLDIEKDARLYAKRAIEWIAKAEGK